MTANPPIPRWMSRCPEGVIIRFYVQPKASRSEVIGEHGAGDAARLKVRVAAPPVEGAANEELIRLLKKLTGIPSSRIHLIRGESAKTKDVLFQGALVEDLAAALA
jgi:uncharacterized protein (TIGR00251 family)